MTEIIYLILLALAGVFIFIGYFFLEPSSAARSKLKRIFQSAALLLPLLYLALLVVNLSGSRGGCALGFLQEPLTIIARGGGIIYHAVTLPRAAGRIYLGLALATGLLLVIIFTKNSRIRAGLLWSSFSLSLLALTFWGERNFTFYWICCGAGVFGLILTRFFSPEEGDKITTKSTAIIVILSLLMTVGFLLRFYRLDLLPPSFLDYEGTTGLSGVEVLEGNRSYFSLLWSFIARPIMNTYSCPFFAFPLGCFFRFFGVSVITLRSLAALIGTITIPALYFLVRRWASRTEALFSAFFLAISIWHITISRVGMALILTPLYAIFIGWAFLRAFKTHKTIYYFLAGMGLGIYWLFYMVAKVMVVVAVLFLLHQLFLKKGFVRRNWKGLIVLFITIAAVALVSGLGTSGWLLGTGKQGGNFIWQRTGANSAPVARIDLDWTWKYFTINLRKSFQYLFLRSHHEFLLPSKLPFINPLIFPFAVLGLAWSLINWKKDLHFFFLALFVCGFIPQVLFVIFSDKAAPRHLMLLIPAYCFFAAQPFSLLGKSLSGRNGPWCRIGPTLIMIFLAGAFTASSFYITFASDHWTYPVYRTRRAYSEFIKAHLSDYYFYVVRNPSPLYLQNRVIDFITYPKVRALHYHLPPNYPQIGVKGAGLTQKYRYLHPRELPAVLSQIGTTIPEAGFVFEDAKLIPLFESAIGPGCVRKRCEECAPWVYYSVLYREVK